MSDIRNPLSAPLRPGSMDVRGQQPSLFPFDAFEFEDPNQNEFPELKMKYPWRLVADYIASSGDAWNYTGVVGIVPEDAYYSGMRAPNESGIALLNLKKDDLIAANDAASVFEVTTQRATIAGSVDYELLGQLTKTNGDPWALTDGYTIIVKSEAEGWEYLSSEGPTEGNMISLVGTTLNIESSNLLPQLLPFMLLGSSEWFQDLMVIPYGYSQSQLDSLLDGIDNFSPIEGNLSADRGYILSPDGFYWYNGGQYIQLGTEAIFSAVDIKSGDYDGEIADGNIITVGTQGWAISHKGDAEFNEGYFRGELVLAGGETVEDALGNKNTVYRQDSMPTTGIEGDIWYDTNDGDLMYVHNGTTFAINYSLRSSDYTEGSSGWAISQDGDVEFNDGKFRGELEAATGTFGGMVGKTYLIEETFSGTENDVFDALEAHRASYSLEYFTSYLITPPTTISSVEYDTIYFTTGYVIITTLGGIQNIYTNGDSTPISSFYIDSLASTSLKGQVALENTVFTEGVSSGSESRIAINGAITSQGNISAVGSLQAQDGIAVYHRDGSGSLMGGIFSFANFSDYLAGINGNLGGTIIQNTGGTTWIRSTINSRGVDIAAAIKAKYGLDRLDYGQTAVSSTYVLPFSGTYGSGLVCHGFLPVSPTDLRVLYTSGSSTVVSTAINPSLTTSYQVNGVFI